MSQEVLQWLTQVAVGLISSGGLAYVLFSHFGKAWMDKKFSQSLENHRHQQSLELQRLRVEIDSLLSGTIRLQEHEFRVLPEAWEKLHEAYSYAASLLAPFQQYADLAAMDDDRLREFLANGPLLKSDQVKVLDTRPEKRNDLYQEALIWHRLNVADGKAVDLSVYIARYGIFLPGLLKEKLEAVSLAIRRCLTTKRLSTERDSGISRTEARDKFVETAEPLYGEIEKLIQERLRSHGQALNADRD